MQEKLSLVKLHPFKPTLSPCVGKCHVLVCSSVRLHDSCSSVSPVQDLVHVGFKYYKIPHNLYCMTCG